jgi:inosose dehydratase
MNRLEQQMIRLANAPCSWGVIENTEGERSDYAKVLDEIQATGYAGTELGDWGFMPTDPETLRAELAARDLLLLGSWVSVRLYDPAYHAAGVEAAVRTAELLAAVGGPDCLIVIGDDHSTVPLRHDLSGRIEPRHMLDESSWRIYAAGAMRVAEAVRRETGLRSVIHHHGATYIETPQEVARMLSLTDPDVLGLCFDTGHYALGGGDPVDGVRRYGDRIWHVHFKDFDGRVVTRAKEEGWGYQQMIAQGVFSELGTGTVDFPGVLAALDDIGYEGWIVVEQDVLPGMGTPKESAARNRGYLRGIGL